MMQQQRHSPTPPAAAAWRDVSHYSLGHSYHSNSLPSASSRPSPASTMAAKASSSALDKPTNTISSAAAAAAAAAAKASPLPSQSAAASSSSSSSSTMLATRPRHHARSFSNERRFDERSDFAAPQAKQQLAARKSAEDGIERDGARPAALSFPSSSSLDATSSPSTSSNPLPVRAKRSPSTSGESPAWPAATQPSTSASPSSVSQSPSSASPTAAAPRGKDRSPQRAEEQDAESKLESEKLAKLRIAQANRRPRVMRMTPAFSSLPGRMDYGTRARGHSTSVVEGSSSTTATDARQSASSSGAVFEFPAKTTDEVGQSASAKSVGESEPPKGLQIDLACIPSPSLVDLEGPVTTSRIENLARDRHGNPIKSSLKTPRSSVSHFLPGRTSRSDSTPAIPSVMLGSKSVPTTPTVPKNVHFDSQLEHVKVFKFKQRPTAVSRDGSPEQTETETEEEKDMFPYIWKKGTSPPNEGSPTSPTKSKHSPQPVEEQLVLRLPNFPSSTRLSIDRPVFLERIFLADDLRSVKGTVQVRNMSFEKWVAVRYTLDHWATIGEVSAEYSESIKGGQADRFCFSIKLNELLNWPRGSAPHETKSMFICLRYTANATEHWDNNEGQNYQLDFRRRPVPVTPTSTPMATSGPPRASSSDLMAASSQSSANRSRVMELARRGVGGKGVFAMEELKRQLEMLRSDDEDEAARTPSLSMSDAFRRRTSPPHSPGASGRASSPSVWTARYDFGTSLRNSRSGSRNTGQGRAAALDYFSAKPMGSPSTPSQALPSGSSSSSHASTPSFTISAASPPMNKKDVEPHPPSSSFHPRFGMISPGLGDGHVEHLPVSHAFSSSTTPSPAVTPTMASHALHSPDRFNTFPPKRHSQAVSTGNYTTMGTSTPTGSGRLSPSTSPSSMSMLRSGSHSPLVGGNAPLSSHDKDGSISSSTSTEASSQSSPRSSPPSDGGSPNPFSPSVSLSSVETDSTAANMGANAIGWNAGSIDAKLRGSSLGDSMNPVPSLLLGATTSPHHSPVTARTSMAIPHFRASLAVSGDASEEHRLRPASMSDYQELVNRFCWNNDLVPSGGSMVPDMPINGGMSKSSAFIDGQPQTSSLSSSMPSSSLTPLMNSVSSPSMASLESHGGSSGSSTPTRLQ